jgi:AP-4 complex subunit mu-1
MISQFFILNFKGDAIFFKDFRGELTTPVTQTFWHELQSTRQKCSPVFNIDGLNYFYIFTNDLYFVSVTKINISPSNVLEQLQAINKLISDFCGLCSEQVVKENSVLITELIDECINYGHVQV